MTPEPQLRSGWLLRLFPSEFRRRYGAPFLEVLERDLAEARELPTRSARLERRLAVWLDVLSASLLERSSSLARRLRRKRGGRKRSAGWGESFLSDLRLATRSIARASGFTVMAVATLSLGLGANTTIFSVLSALILEPLPYEAPERLGFVRVDLASRAGWHGLSPTELRELAELDAVFEGVGGIRPNFAEVMPMGMDVIGDNGAERVQGIEVTDALLPVLGVKPFRGRLPVATDRDGDTGPRHAVAISYEFWQRRFSGDPELVGESIVVENSPVTVVGVLPPGVRLHFDPVTGVPPRADVWAVAYMSGERTDRYLRTVVRLRGGVELEQAEQALAVLAERMYDTEPAAYGDRAPRFSIVRLQRDMVGSVEPTLVALAIAVGFVLLIACANVVGLMLARNQARERELAVRLALGGSNGRVARFLMLESLLMALAGGAGAVLFSVVGVDVVRLVGSASLPRVVELGVDPRALVFAFGLAASVGIALGGWSEWQRRRLPLGVALRSGGRLAGDRRGGRFRDLLTVVQVGASLVLLVGAGLMVRTLVNMSRVDTGFSTERVAVFKVPFDHRAIPLGVGRWHFHRDLIQRLEAEPEIASASGIFVLPTRGGFSEPVGRTTTELERGDRLASVNTILPGYFETLGIPLLAGRDFELSDSGEGDTVQVIVDQSLAETMWPRTGAIGQRLLIDFDLEGRDRSWGEVVGVVGHVRQDGLRRVGLPQVYVPYWDRPFWGMFMVARSRSTPEAALGAVERVAALMPEAQFVHSRETLTAVVAEQSHAGRLVLMLLTAFSVIAVALTATGLYGVISFAVGQRVREIGIRMAAGATRRDVLEMIVGRGARLCALGIASGTFVAIAVARTLETLLFGVASLDPFTYVAVAALLLFVGVSASWLPARRAAAVDPVAALRSD